MDQVVLAYKEQQDLDSQLEAENQLKNQWQAVFDEIKTKGPELWSHALMKKKEAALYEEEIKELQLTIKELQLKKEASLKEEAIINDWVRQAVNTLAESKHCQTKINTFADRKTTIISELNELKTNFDQAKEELKIWCFSYIYISLIFLLQCHLSNCLFWCTLYF